LRKHGVTGRFVEFFGPAATALTVPERATLANMAPEYRRDRRFFPVDANTLAYLRATGRSEQSMHASRRIAAPTRCFAMPMRQAGVFASRRDRSARRDATIAGPKRPQDRLPLAKRADGFSRAASRARA
jgi:aconitate hydratase